MILILSIESSCDDSSIALTNICDKKLIFHRKISQDNEHKNYGGVVPELASRLHATALPKILSLIQNQLQSVRAIAVTNEPGLSVSLIEGVMMAKALALSLNLPLIAINHLKGHIYSLFLQKPAIFPLSILLLSGGHTLILEAENDRDIKIISSTLDDSFGEAFDKVAKMLDLGYPGGVEVESCAKSAKNKNLIFPIPLKHKKSLEFSFSGLKNAIRIHIQNANKINKSEICYAFQNAAIAHISQKIELYLKNSNIKHFGVVGGASANQSLRTNLIAIVKKYHKEILFAPLEFCSDNAAMIGRCAIESYKNHDFIDICDLTISPKSRIFG